MTDFIVIGLPRSGTTWIANWLTTDKSLCLHDPFGLGLPETWPRDNRRFGISCTGAYLFPKWLSGHKGPLVKIVRNACDRKASLEKIGWGGSLTLSDAFSATSGYTFDFDDLWDEDAAHNLWDYLLPEIPFDSIRYRMLRDIQVQPHLDKVPFDQSVFDTMKAREAGG